ncbi:protein kinase domain-containing protein [Ditylenchus destructor]|uniref:Protein kinase domain-containing protein n=1 Tax=Ditylenchus destructor TaxID=166010 RepID=A0AAD4N039_9BILA|nr:protein kinase domain-containing protein [Ditylenchus destructor]
MLMPGDRLKAMVDFAGHETDWEMKDETLLKQIPFKTNGKPEFLLQKAPVKNVGSDVHRSLARTRAQPNLRTTLLRAQAESKVPGSVHSPQSPAQQTSSNANDVSDTMGPRLTQTSRARSSSVGSAKDVHQSLKGPSTSGAPAEDHIYDTLLRDGGLTISDQEKTVRRGTHHSARSPVVASPTDNKHKNKNDIFDTVMQEGGLTVSSSPAKSTHRPNQDSNILADVGLTIGSGTPEKTIRPSNVESAAVAAVDVSRLDTRGFAADHATNPGFSGFPEDINPGNRRCSRRNQYQSSCLAETKLFMYHMPKSDMRRVICDLGKSRIFRISGSHKSRKSPMFPAKPVPIDSAGRDEAIHEFPTYGWVTLVKVLGEGTFGKVWSAESDTLPDREMAVKIIKIDKNDKDFEYDTERARSEIEIHSRFGLIPHGSDKPIDINIIGYYDSIMDETSDRKFSFYYILMEKGESTFYGFVNALRKYGRLLNTREIQFYAIEMIKPLKKLHAKQIIHRDLKETNIFYGTDGRLKMGDFGAGRKIDDDDGAHTMIGTPKFMAPRVTTKDDKYKTLFPEEYEDGYTFDADWWAFAVILYRLFYNKKYPFADDNAAREGKLQFGKLPKSGEELNKDIQDLLTTLLTPNLVKEATFETVLKNPWIAEGMKYWEGKKPPFWIEEKEVDFLCEKYYTNGEENYYMT